MSGRDSPRSAPPRITILLAIALAIGARLALPPEPNDARHAPRSTDTPLPPPVASPPRSHQAEAAGHPVASPLASPGALWPLAPGPDTYPSFRFEPAPDAP